MPTIAFQNIQTIFRREVRAYFNSPVAYVVIVVFLAITGWFFTSTLFLNNVASMYMVFESFVLRILLIVFAPAVTMRLLAEERKSGTFELLATKPVRDSEIVLGKFLAAWALLGATLLPTLLYLFTLMFLGSIDIGPVISGYIGLLLVGGVYIAIGLLASSLTENQIVAFIISFLIIVVFFLLDKMLMFVPEGLTSTMEFLSIDSHYSSIARGVIDSRDLLYFLSLLGFSLYLTSVSLERRKW